MLSVGHGFASPNSGRSFSPVEVPPRYAPMLQPPAFRAPTPIRTPPRTAATAVRHGIELWIFHAPAAAAATAAPIMIPMSVRLFLSFQIGPASDVALDFCCQNSQDSGCSPNTCRILAPHNENALVTPQIPPETRNTAPASTPSTTAPTRIGHEPRKTRAKPCAVGTTSTGGGVRRRCTARLTMTIPASTAIVIAHV